MTLPTPEHEFAVRTVFALPLGPWRVPVSNVVLAETTGALAGLGLLVWLARGAGVRPGLRGVVIEAWVEFVDRAIAGALVPEAAWARPWVFALFCFLLFGNAMGLVPLGVAPHAQIAITGGFAALVFAVVIAVRVRNFGWRFGLAFLPRGVPWWLAPLVVPIELISFLARPVTLAVRLFANMTAGHMALAVLAGLGLGAPVWLAWMPFGFSIAQMALESVVAVLQAYIFCILACVYLNDAYRERH